MKRRLTDEEVQGLKDTKQWLHQQTGIVIFPVFIIWKAIERLTQEERRTLSKKNNRLNAEAFKRNGLPFMLPMVLTNLVAEDLQQGMKMFIPLKKQQESVCIVLVCLPQGVIDIQSDFILTPTNSKAIKHLIADFLGEDYGMEGSCFLCQVILDNKGGCSTNWDDYGINIDAFKDEGFSVKLIRLDQTPSLMSMYRWN